MKIEKEKFIADMLREHNRRKQDRITREAAKLDAERQAETVWWEMKWDRRIAWMKKNRRKGRKD